MIRSPPARLSSPTAAVLPTSTPSSTAPASSCPEAASSIWRISSRRPARTPACRSRSPAMPRARRRRTSSASCSGLLAGFIILLVLFRALVPTAIPLLFAIAAVATAFLLLFLAARYTNFNTIVTLLVPMIGLGVGIDYTLFIVTRFRQMLHDGLEPRDAAAAAGATAGRAVIFAGVTVAISVTGPGADRHRLHHQARHRQRAGRAHGGAAGELAAAGGAVVAGPPHRFGTARHEANGRIARGPAAHAGGAVGPVRRGQRQVRAPTGDRAPAAAGIAGAEGAAGPGRRRHRAEGPNDPHGLRPALRPGRIRPGIHVADPGRDRSQLRPHRRGQDQAGHAGGTRRGRGREADLQRQDGGQGERGDRECVLASTRRRT